MQIYCQTQGVLVPSPDEVLDNKPDGNGIWICWFLRRGENRSTRRKTSRSKEENKQQTQPTYDAGSSIQTWDTLVGGEHSHHCTIPAPQKTLPAKKLYLLRENVPEDRVKSQKCGTCLKN